MKLSEFLYPNRNVNDMIRVKTSKGSNLLYEGYSINIINSTEKKDILNRELGIWKVEDKVFTAYVK